MLGMAVNVFSTTNAITLREKQREREGGGKAAKKEGIDLLIHM